MRGEPVIQSRCPGQPPRSAQSFCSRRKQILRLGLNRLRRWRPPSESNAHKCRPSECGKTKDLRVVFVTEIVYPSEHGHPAVDLVLGRDVHERVIFDIEVRTAEIQFFAGVYELRLDRRPKFFTPEI